MSKVIAVVPSYNSADLVCERITQLQNSSFDRIIVCDDNSDDNTVARLREQFGNSIKVIAGEENLGPGGNRNRILRHDSIDDADYVFFIDADCRITYTGDIAEHVAAGFELDSTGVVGYSLTDPTDKPMRWNYGDLMHPVREAPDQKLDDMLAVGVITEEQFIEWAPARAASFRLLPEDTVKEVGWVAEGCFAARATLFKLIGGFAEQMRYHETHDFNARVQEQGYRTLFDPTAVAQHLEHDSRMQRRDDDIRSGRLYYYQRHWGMNAEVFARLFDE